MIQYISLSVNDISFDTDNPRIKKALEKYRDKITAQRIHFALAAASDGENSTSSFRKLSDSIRAYGGITQPITVYKQDGKYTCIDGNTRLAIYKDFIKKDIDGNWSSINTLALENPTQKEIASVRISAHLVGARPWPAYEKARYLHHLYYEEFKDFDEMVALCGGNKNEIDRQIQAYNDMNEYYRDKVADDEFKIDRFSGFVELQKSNIKDSILEADLGLENFGSWIKNGNIKSLADVRKLPSVLNNSKAKKIFLEGNIDSIKNAIKHIEQNQTHAQNITLEKATFDQLTVATTSKLSSLTLSELNELHAKNEENNLKIANIEDLFDVLKIFLENVRK